MPAGHRNERIRFERESRTTDNMGGFTVDWQTLIAVDVRAEIAPLSGREVVQAQQVQGRAMYRVVIPNIRTILVSDRIVWRSNGDKILNIRDLSDPGVRAIERTLTAEDAPETKEG